jgi:hypothetical protein
MARFDGQGQALFRANFKAKPDCFFDIFQCLFFSNLWEKRFPFYSVDFLRLQVMRPVVGVH